MRSLQQCKGVYIMSVNFSDKPFMNALLGGNIPFNELMNAYNIRVTIANLDGTVYGFTYISRLGNIHIILNGNIEYVLQCKVFLHELKHILNDCPKQSYFVGLDMQYTYIEKDADKVAKEVMSNFFNP